MDTGVLAAALKLPVPVDEDARADVCSLLRALCLISTTRTSIIPFGAIQRLIAIGKATRLDDVLLSDRPPVRKRRGSVETDTVPAFAGVSATAGGASLPVEHTPSDWLGKELLPPRMPPLSAPGMGRSKSEDSGVDDGVPTPLALAEASAEEWTHVDKASVPLAVDCDVPASPNMMDGILSTIRRVTDDAMRTSKPTDSTSTAPASPPPGSDLV